MPLPISAKSTCVNESTTFPHEREIFKNAYTSSSFYHTQATAHQQIAKAITNAYTGRLYL
jgi:hypothetical protein